MTHVNKSSFPGFLIPETRFSTFYLIRRVFPEFCPIDRKLKDITEIPYVGFNRKSMIGEKMQVIK